MSNGTAFYICGGLLVASALLVAFAGLRMPSFPPSRAILGAVVAYMALLVGGTTTFAVLHSRDERQKLREEQAAGDLPTPAEVSQNLAQGAVARSQPTTQGGGSSTSSTSTTTSTGTATGGGAGGGGTSSSGGGGAKTTLNLAADPSAIAYDTTKLSAKAGSVTIDFKNPSPLTHDVCVQSSSGQSLGCSDTISQGSSSLTADLKPGSYTFYCSVDGHEAAGMKGTLTVK